ncbi:hypothetical protein ABN028_24130 [Actinopolymorpha sp. B17G11]|uniref:hypothetical protein n=1 Tax=Actinopolymorpha sp. B17G11 TaxID=3160861 RepID=UPI0032E4C5DF
MTLMSLLGVVVHEFLDVGLDELNFGEDLVGCGGPGERLGVGVPVLDVDAIWLMRTLIEPKVPRRIDIPNQVSIWLIQVSTRPG